MVGHGSGSPRKWFLSCGRALLAALLSGRGQISTDGRERKYSNAGYSSKGGALSCSAAHFY